MIEPLLARKGKKPEVEKLSTPFRCSVALEHPQTCSALAGLFFLIGALPVMAMPMFGDEFSHLQPDGTRVTVRIWGDEFYRVVESLDGYTLVYDSVSKAGCYARLSPDGNRLVSTGVWVKGSLPPGLNLQKHIRINPEAKRSLIAQKRAQHTRLEQEAPAASGLRGGPPPSPPNQGNVQAIVLLIDFADDQATIPPSSVDDYCNQVGYSGYGNNGSVRDYFYDVSDGVLTYTNYVPSTYYRALQPKSYYTEPGFGVDRARELVLEALEDLEAQGFDFSQYDSNGDGLIDGINALYAGFVDSAFGLGLWPHSWVVDWVADGVSTNRYQITDLASMLLLSTFCHENGHMLCYWPDLYDYGFDSAGAGRYCLMSYSGTGPNPVEPCGYLKYVAGWTDTTNLLAPQVDLPVPSDSNTIYRIAHPSKWNEYFIIENRDQVDRDATLPDAGLAIWHIDELGGNSNEENTPTIHYEALLVQADGLGDLENNVNWGDADDFWGAPQYTQCTPSTSPNTNWWDGSSSDIRITDISAPGPVMTFDFLGPPIDCNGNGVPDSDDLAAETSRDCNADQRPDECGVIDDCELDKLSDPNPQFRFGWSVAVDGDVALVGIAGATCPAGSGCGSVDVYRFDGTHWVFEDNLSAPVREANDSFGAYVALGGDLAVIGASGDKCPGGAPSCGSVHLFRHVGGSWNFEATLQATDAASGDALGSCVSVAGDVVVAGAYPDDCPAGGNCGSAYVFGKIGGTWSQQTKLVAPDATENDWFGISLAVDGNWIAVGAPGDSCAGTPGSSCGSVYLFAKVGANWTFRGKLSERKGYGYAVALQEDLLLVGAPLETCGLSDSCGALYFYRFDGFGWNREIRVTGAHPDEGDFFGRSIGLSGNLAVVGATGVGCFSGSSCGKAYVFRHNGTDWTLGPELVASDASSFGQLGLSAAISGNLVMMGSDGAAYAFAVGDGDCNCNGLADVCEVNGGTAIDVDGNGVIDHCETYEPMPAPYPHDRRKNRYISFDPNKEANDGADLAFKVELKSLTLGSCSGNGGFCRADRGGDDCNTCVGAPAENACINQAIDCTSGTCTPTGETCVNDAPNAGGSNVGRVWWVGPENPANPSVHLLVSQSFRKVSTNWPNPVHLGDCEVVPEARYGIRAVDVGSGTESAELLVETALFAGASSSWWGDCVGPLKKFCGGDIRTPECAGDGDCTAPETCDRAWTPPDGSVNFDDVNAALALVAPGATSVAPDPTWVDLHGNGTGSPGSQNFDPPNGAVNFPDIGQIISGFSGFPYKGYDPADCPDEPDWP